MVLQLFSWFHKTNSGSNRNMEEEVAAACPTRNTEEAVGSRGSSMFSSEDPEQHSGEQAETRSGLSEKPSQGDGNKVRKRQIHGSCSTERRAAATGLACSTVNMETSGYSWRRKQPPSPNTLLKCKYCPSSFSQQQEKD